jgi:hypothetical protein
MLSELKPIAYLIGNSDQEMIAKFEILPNAIHRYYTTEAFLAYRFNTMKQANIIIDKLDKPGLFVVPMFDMGDTYVVGWP